MATVTTFQIPTARVPRSPAENATGIAFTAAVVSGSCPQNDNIACFVPPSGAQIVGAVLSHDATLGASATAQLRIGTTAITGASTAGAASTVVQTVAAGTLCDGTNAVNILIAGAAITASTSLRVSLIMILPRG